MNGRVLIVVVCVLGIAGTYAMRLKNNRTELPDWVPGQKTLPLAPVGERRINAFWTYGLALKDYRLYAWGGSGSQAFPGMRQYGIEAPVVLDKGLTDWRYIQAGIAAAYAVTKDGQLLRRQMNYIPSDADAPVFERVFPGPDWVKAVQLMYMTVGLDADGGMYFWSERLWQPGATCANEPDACGGLDPRDPPVGKSLAWRLPGKARWTDACLTGQGDGRSQRYAAFALDAEGKLFRIEFTPESFDRAYDQEAKMVPLLSAVPFQRVYCGGNAVMLLDRERRLWGFGDNNEGEIDPVLKAVEDEQKVFPHMIKPDAMHLISERRWLTVAPGYGFSLGISARGHLYAWGNDYARRIRKDWGAGKSVAMELVDDTREWAEVAHGTYYVVARDAKGEVYTWGQAAADRNVNSYVRGLLGDGGVAEHRAAPRALLMPPDA